MFRFTPQLLITRLLEFVEQPVLDRAIQTISHLVPVETGSALISSVT
jgi:hypothetical protein